MFAFYTSSIYLLCWFIYITIFIPSPHLFHVRDTSLAKAAVLVGLVPSLSTTLFFILFTTLLHITLIGIHIKALHGAINGTYMSTHHCTVALHDSGACEQCSLHIASQHYARRTCAHCVIVLDHTVNIF